MCYRTSISREVYNLTSMVRYIIEITLVPNLDRQFLNHLPVNLQIKTNHRVALQGIAVQILDMSSGFGKQRREVTPELDSLGIRMTQAALSC